MPAPDVTSINLLRKCMQQEATSMIVSAENIVEEPDDGDESEQSKVFDQSLASLEDSGLTPRQKRRTVLIASPTRTGETHN